MKNGSRHADNSFDMLRLFFAVLVIFSHSFALGRQLRIPYSPIFGPGLTFTRILPLPAATSMRLAQTKYIPILRDQFVN
jgi:hypothetical protein